MDDVFGTKELYDISLKTTFPMKIGNREYEEDETILHFDQIEIATLDVVKSRIAAVGGFDNRPRVIWEQTRQINYTMKKGVLSKNTWAILSNSQLIEQGAGLSPLKIDITEELESDEQGVITLKYTPDSESKLFLYNKTTGAKITNYTLSGKKITILTPYTEVIVEYRYLYNKEKSTLMIGKRLLEGYLKLEGKVELKDDKDGLEKTGILIIPKMTLVTDLSIRLGTDAQPFMGNFEIIGHPVGPRGNTSVCSITFLEDNLRSDI